MSTLQTDIKAQSIELATTAFDAFCDDISGMFGVDMKCAAKSAYPETIKGLSQKFKNLVAINFIKSEGILNGTFHIVFDQPGLFTLAGIIVMLPKQKILDNINHNSAQDTEAATVTIKEAGNLLVGSWDRIFREGMEGHGHFVQSNTFIGNLWDNPKEKIYLPDTEEVTFLPYEITIGDFPAFNCGVIFPEAIFIELPKGPVLAEEKSDKEPAAGPVSETIQKIVQISSTSEGDLQSLNICAKDIMQKGVLWGNGDDSVQQTMTKMEQAETSYMMIGKDELLEGVVSTFDLASALSIYLKPAFAKWRRPADDATLQIKVKWIMTKPVRTVKSDTSVLTIMESMCQSGLRCMPVMEKTGKIIGLITVFDIFKAILKS